jgi:ELWxxDGT repeat protein
VVWTGQTKLVVDMNSGTADAIDALFGFGHRNEFMAEYKGTLFFQGSNSSAGSELFRLEPDGLPIQVADLATGSASSWPHSFAVLQDVLYFAATRDGGERVIRYDGTSVQTVSAVPAAEGAKITALTAFGNAVYFVRTANDKTQLWRTNGTSAEAVNAVNSTAGTIDTSDLMASPLVPFKGKLYFVKKTSVPERYELWSYDGASEAKKIRGLTVADDVTERGFDLGVYKSHLYFGRVVPKDDLFHQDELWRYDGVNPPTKVFAFSGNASSYSQPADYVVYQDKLHFTSGSGFWSFDGVSVEELDTALGYVPSGIQSVSPFPSASRLFLSGFYGDWTDAEPYVYDGTSATLAKEIMPDEATPNAGSFPTFGVDVNGQFYFFAEDQEHGRELWRITKSERVLLKCDIVVAPVWDDWRRWPVDRRDVIVTTWEIRPDGRRLISREALTVSRRQELRVPVLERDTRRQDAPFALATVVFDRQTGEVLDSGYDIVGSPDARLRRTLERGAAGLVRRGTMREAMAERVQ